MLVFLLTSLISNAVTLIRDQSILFSRALENTTFFDKFYLMLYSGFSQKRLEKFFYIIECIMHPPRNPHVFVNKPLESGIYSPIKKIFLFLYGRRSNIILSLGGLILLLIPLKIFFNILDLMVYFPLVSSIYASLFTAVSLLCRGKELPSLLGFINIITFVFFIAVCIQQLNVQDLACFFLSFMASSELLFFNSDYSYKAGNKSVLLMDNMQPGSGSQPEAQSKGTTYNPTSQNPSLNITSDSDKVRVEGIYNSEEVKYTDKRSILNSSFYTFTRY